MIQAITAQQIKDDHQPDHVVQGHEGKQGSQGQTVQQNSQVPQKVGQQHITKPTVQHSMDASKVTVQIPSKVQQVVTQVSQHIPMLVEQHVANQQNKQRMVRSLTNRLTANNAEKPRKCAYDCSPSDLPVCAYNGRCYQEFQSQCEMSAYNCLNTQKSKFFKFGILIYFLIKFLFYSQKGFHLAHDAQCQDSSAVKCYPGDM